MTNIYRQVYRIQCMDRGEWKFTPGEHTNLYNARLMKDVYITSNMYKKHELRIVKETIEENRTFTPIR